MGLAEANDHVDAATHTPDVRLFIDYAGQSVAATDGSAAEIPGPRGSWP